MSHPVRFYTDYELANFAGFILRNPNGPQAEGAFDSAPNRKYRGRGIPRHEFSPRGAYDQRPRGVKHLGRDAELESEEKTEGGEKQADLDQFAALAVRFAREMSVKEWMDLYARIQSEGAVDDDPDVDETGLPKAMDASIFPGTQRIAFDTIGIQPTPKPARISAKAAASFHEIFPEARR